MIRVDSSRIKSPVDLVLVLVNVEHIVWTNLHSVDLLTYVETFHEFVKGEHILTSVGLLQSIEHAVTNILCEASNQKRKTCLLVIASLY